MEIKEHKLTIEAQYPVYTVNELCDTTKNIWIACHGYGQLARHFVKRFDILPEDSNYIVAPQGLSRFYLDGNYGHVGSSWMTKENREMDLINQKRYFDAIFDTYLSKVDWTKVNLNYVGFSQGVPLAIRIASYKQIPVRKLILWAGDLPKEITADDFNFLHKDSTISLVIGNRDKFFNEEIIEHLNNKIQKITGLVPDLIVFDGKHEVQRAVLKDVIT